MGEMIRPGIGLNGHQPHTMTPEDKPTRRIKLLPDDLINRIAAGEVVERPSAVLKELVENSLDAGADRIDIEILTGGKKLIRVRDNGRGMDQDDLFLSLERHATSKIEKDADLMNIATLGFRGEALPSIASVSKMTVTSATGNGPGHVVTVYGGRLGPMAEAPANQGTTVEVADLFYNVPARRKFLKSDDTESAHLLDVAQAYALSRQGLRLTFRDKGREVLAVESRHDFKTRVFRVLGRRAAESLLPFQYQGEGLSLTGWVGGPESFVRSPANIFIYVLGRPVKDRLLNRALANGYGRLLSPGQWPTAVVFIDLDPGEVDVNVHPAKAEVRFRRPQLVFSALGSAVSGVIGRGPVPAAELRDPVPAFEGRPSVPADAPTLPGLEDRPAIRPEDFLSPDPQPVTEPQQGPYSAVGLCSRTLSSENRPLTSPIFSEPPWMVEEGAGQPGEIDLPTSTAFEAKSAAAVPEAGSDPAEVPGAIPSEEGLPTAPVSVFQPDRVVADFLARPSAGVQITQADLAELRPLSQLYQSYILAQGAKGLYIIDQHAAHERILYNQLKATLDREGLAGQALLFPDTTDLPPEQSLAAERLQPHLERLGFDLQPFGDRTFILKSAPAILGERDPWPPLLEILGTVHGRFKAMEGAGLTEALDALAGSWLYSLACRAAIKAGDKMSLEAMERLLADMAVTPHGAFCPHGRPAIQLIERYTIEKRFDRR